MDYIAENEKRRKALFAPFDPLTGEGSLLERTEIKITTQKTVRIPNPMLEHKAIQELVNHYSIYEFCLFKDIDYNKFLELFNVIREKYDFEYYCFENVKIFDKTTSELIPFKLNRAQRKVLVILENQRTQNKPIRIKLLKSRQWGGSTLIQIYMNWLQIKWRENWNSVIVSDVESQAKAVRYMYKTAIANFPSEKHKFSTVPFEGSSKDIMLKDRGCRIAIGSMQQPDTIRSTSNYMAHLTELGLWKKTENKEPKDVIQSVVGSIPKVPYSLIALESTAKGVGNYWHNTWIENNAYEPVFVGWYEIEHNTVKVPDIQLFIQSLNEYEKYLFEMGATLEGIHWYRLTLSELGGDMWRMQSEHPTTPQEAFQSTGNRVFAPQDVEKFRNQCVPPIAKGKLFAKSEKGKEALMDIKFNETPNGDLWIWEFPDNVRAGLKPAPTKITNRYIVVVDIGGTAKNADYSVITVMDRYLLTKGGVPKTVARMRYHLEQSFMAWDAVRIAKYYNDALLVIENNSLKKNKNEAENHFTTVLNEIEDYYDNLYTYEDLTKVKEGVPIKWGFHTNSATKPMVISTLRSALKEGGFIDYDSRLYHECDTYEIDSQGAYNAVDGEHDDIVMSTAIALYVSSKMDAPRIVERTIGRAKASVSLRI